jgi:uncharacterized protein with FMN-binding domain
MRSLTESKTAALIAGLALATGLAGCAATTDDGPDPNAVDPAPPSPSATDGGSADTGTGGYADGTYTESGDYQAPSGTETVTVTVTLADDTVTAVEVTGDATDPQAMLHQKEFIDGIGAVVVGKKLDDLQVDRVGGSSLTSGGFNAAIAAIKVDAAQ